MRKRRKEKGKVDRYGEDIRNRYSAGWNDDTPWRGMGEATENEHEHEHESEPVMVCLPRILQTEVFWPF